MARRFATHTIHSFSYYKRLLLALRRHLLAGHSHRQIAEALNFEGIASPAGLAFDGNMVKALLWGIRNPFESRSGLHRAMTHLHFEGELTREQCMPLVSMRAGTQR